jgi:hypothetical protein
MNSVNPALLVILSMLLLHTANAEKTAASDSSVNVPLRVIKDQPLFETPGEMLPEKYTTSRDTLRIDSTAVDSMGKQWAHVRAAGKPLQGWIPKGLLVPFSAKPDSLLVSGPLNTDRRRRYEILREHPDWPRRIQAAVREGTVCMDMTRSQLTASWGEPFQKGKAFLFGIGNYEIWFYKGHKNETLMVSIYGERVTGWSIQ